MERTGKAVERGEETVSLQTQFAQAAARVRAELPRLPVYPKPMRFYALGIFAGCLLFVGPLVAGRFLRPVVSSEAGLRSLTDVPVLVTIPRVVTEVTRGQFVRRTLKNVALSTLCVAMVVTAFLLLGAS